jgi:hypothetical protein
MSTGQHSSSGLEASQHVKGATRQNDNALAGSDPNGAHPSKPRAEPLTTHGVSSQSHVSTPCSHHTFHEPSHSTSYEPRTEHSPKNSKANHPSPPDTAQTRRPLQRSRPRPLLPRRNRTRGLSTPRPHLPAQPHGRSSPNQIKRHGLLHHPRLHILRRAHRPRTPRPRSDIHRAPPRRRTYLQEAAFRAGGRGCQSG